MAEWLKAAVLKTAEAETLPGVRIPLPPIYKSKDRMGAKFSVWVLRIVAAVLFTAAMLGLWLSAFAPWAKGLITGLIFVAAALLAFWKEPAFDPLGRVRWRVPSKGRKLCAITFDDGPSAATSQVLDALAQAGVPATFFVLTKHAERYPELLRRAQAEGHAIGIHGVTHRKLDGATEPTVKQEIQGALERLRALGVTPASLYRSPHGFKSRAVFRVAQRLGLSIWAWSRGVWDTDLPPSEVLVLRATRCARPGMVLLLHDGRGDEQSPNVSPMIAALPHIIEKLKKKGFDFVRLDRIDLS
jgi:peptidoglycan/xylan/chitin deacetylase (PgdA/CDA1 family)